MSPTIVCDVTEAIYDLRESRNCPRTFDTVFIRRSFFWTKKLSLLPECHCKRCHCKRRGLYIILRFSGFCQPCFLDVGFRQRVVHPMAHSPELVLHPLKRPYMISVIDKKGFSPRSVAESFWDVAVTLKF